MKFEGIKKNSIRSARRGPKRGISPPESPGQPQPNYVRFLRIVESLYPPEIPFTFPLFTGAVQFLNVSLNRFSNREMH